MPQPHAKAVTFLTPAVVTARGHNSVSSSWGHQTVMWPCFLSLHSYLSSSWTVVALCPPSWVPMWPPTVPACTSRHQSRYLCCLTKSRDNRKKWTVVHAKWHIPSGCANGRKSIQSSLSEAKVKWQGGGNLCQLYKSHTQLLKTNHFMFPGLHFFTC